MLSLYIVTPIYRPLAIRELASLIARRAILQRIA